MWCVWEYLYSHYDMCLGAMRKVCLTVAQGKEIQGFHEDVVRQSVNEGEREHMYCAKGPDLIKIKKNTTNLIFTPSFILHFIFHLFSFLHWKTTGPSPSAAVLLFCAEGRWQKELCKRAFKIPKWLWSVHNGPKNAVLDKDRPLPHHSALQWWIRTDAWTWAGVGAVEAPPRPPLGQPKGTGLRNTLEPQPRASKQSRAAN